VRRLAATTAAAVTLTITAAEPALAQARYTVRFGDTLSGIAVANGVSVGGLARANGLDPDGILLAGATLRIPGGGDAGARSYRVRFGDTLSGIAARHGVGLEALARANGLDPDGILLAGTRLRIPGSGGGTATTIRYTVRFGDTLSGIAARHGIGVDALARANGLDPDGILLAGATLAIPSAGAAPAAGGDVTGSIDRWAGHYGVDARLVRALAWLESGYQPDVVSAAGARGVMQVLPATWRYVERVLIGARVPQTADGNVRVGVAFLHSLLHQFGGDERLALAAYYQGPESVRRRGLLPVSERYVADVLALRDRM
jgi:LysM repeat protein